ncbi:MAG: hypothetical protein ACYCUI_12390 [Vulcanimicrobiaceae bacterium]|jgi:hypothetical protein|nr:hypothetical protein [Betaproteobacteria bacterium]
MTGPAADLTNTGRRSRIEDALRLDVRELRRQGLLRSGRHGVDNIASIDGGVIAETHLMIDLDKEQGRIEIQGRWANGTVIDKQLIRLVSTPQHLGGRRWWLLCPNTGRRADVLLHFCGSAGFYCRLAWDPLPIYSCQRTSPGTHLYERIGALRRRMGATGDNPQDTLLKLPCRPKHMRQQTYLSQLAKLLPLLTSPDLPILRFAGRQPDPLRDLETK